MVYIGKRIRIMIGRELAMSGWESFFVGELGASAALSGLVFVGISINLATILMFPWLPNMALEALVALVTVLFSSSLLLIPGQTFPTMGVEVLLVGLAAWTTFGLLLLNSLRKLEAEDRGVYIRNTMFSQLAALAFVSAGVVLLFVGAAGLYFVVAATLLSFLTAFINAWVLLIEINR